MGWLARPVDGMARFAAGLMNGLFSCDCVSGLCARIAVCRVKANIIVNGGERYGECRRGYT